jgi:hypothetical protein
MSSLKPKDRVSLCLLTFTHGRRCRTPRIATHPHFCFYHAQQESQARAAETLGKDLDYLFSGDYLSACDLSTLARLIHISQDEYIKAFRNPPPSSPPKPQPAPVKDPYAAHYDDRYRLVIDGKPF